MVLVFIEGGRYYPENRMVEVALSGSNDGKLKPMVCLLNLEADEPVSRDGHRCYGRIQDPDYPVRGFFYAQPQQNEVSAGWLELCSLG